MTVLNEVNPIEVFVMKDMNAAITNLANSMTADFALWHERAANDISHEVKDSMLAKFENGLSFVTGRKYIKVLTERSCAGFIVNTEDDPKFEYGDLLMASSFTAPARNKARGNIFNNDDVLNVRWTGVA